VKRELSAGNIPWTPAIAVLCDILHRSADGHPEGERSAICEDYLADVNVERPSELGNESDPVARRLLIYFFRYVAIPSILDSHICYESSSEVEDERIAVCQRLIELDPENRAIYTDEIAQITHRQLIQEGVQRVEKSKIHVDVDGIRDSVIQGSKDLFERYRSLPVSPIHEIAEIVLEIAQRMGKSGVRLVVPRNERLAAFNQLFSLVRDKFVSSSEYGLDVYLSVGIRHGTLAGQLRSVFEQEDILARRDETGRYILPAVWMSRFQQAECEDSCIQALSAALITFTEGVDSAISDLRDKRIQINTEVRPTEGWFDFRFSATQLGELEVKARPIEAFDRFIELVFQELWKRTDLSLARIRSAFIGELRDRLSDLISQLNRALTDLPNSGAKTSMLTALTRVRPLLQSELVSISSWFTSHGRKDTDPYSLETAIGIAKKMFDRCNPALQFSIERKGVGGELSLKGSTLSGMVEILFLLFSNVGKYGLQSERRIRCNIAYAVKSDSLEITMTNTVSPETVGMYSSKLASLLASIRRNENFDKVKTEGGTGIYKLAKILRVDFQSQAIIDFSYRDNEVYELNFRAEKGRLFP
jgi:hypothetical protein